MYMTHGGVRGPREHQVGPALERAFQKGPDPWRAEFPFKLFALFLLLFEYIKFSDGDRAFPKRMNAQWEKIDLLFIR